MPPFMSAFVRNPERVRFETQEPGETIILLLRAHSITTLKWFITALLLAFIPYIFARNVVFFGLSPTDLTTSRFIHIFGVVWELLILGFVIEQFLLYYFNVYIVTNLRIIDISFTNVVSRKVSETRLVDIEDVTFTQNGVIRSIFNYGDVMVQTAGTAPEFYFYAVPNPSEVVTAISDLQQHTESGGE